MGLSCWRVAVAAGATALAVVATSCSVAADDSGITVGPYLMQPTPRGVTVCWVTDQPSTRGVVLLLDGAATSASTRPLQEFPEAGAATRYHRIEIHGLNPHTQYRYEIVGPDGKRHAGARFTSAATAQQGSFRFVAYGDNRTQPDKHAAVTARIRAFQPEFVLQTGDMVANGADEDQWATFWKVAQPLYAAAPVFPALGNHEDHAAPYFRYFGVPAYYSFDYGNAHFVALDSSCPESEWEPQEQWLALDLAKHREATWRIVFFHHTVYTCTTVRGRREEGEILRQRLEPILERGHVQLVVNGHDHTYQRHLAKDGITWIVSGGGGAPLYPVRKDTPYVKAAESTYNDCEITVDGERMSVRAVRPDGSVIDRFTLTAR